MSRVSILASALVLAGLTLSTAAQSAEPGYYRSPTIAGETLVFTAEGDLWRHHPDQATPVRLTSHRAEETGAQISPDGQQLAFVANYEGVPEVYVMPLSGGTPTRLSFENSQVRLQGWTPNGEVLYSTDNVVGPANQWMLRTVEPSSGQATTLPLTDAIEGTYRDSGDTLFFTRFGLQATGDNARYYRGGAMGEIWSFNPSTDDEAQLLTGTHEGSVRQPMYWADRVYFISDASGTPNIWSMTPAGEDFRQHTAYTEGDYQVWSASLSEGQLVYQYGADLRQLDLDDGVTRKLSLTLPSDFTERQERWLADPLDYITQVAFGSGTEQVALTARSQVALASAGPRRLVEIQTPAGSRTREAILDHTGDWVYAFNDHTGENEIWRFPADGSAGAEQLTDDGSTFRWSLSLSPDGQYLAHDDKDGQLWIMNLGSGEQQLVSNQGFGHRGFRDLVWSPDSQRLAYTKEPQEGPRLQVFLYDLAAQEKAQLTTDKYESYSPTFSADGGWLYFLSDRHFDPQPRSPWGDRNMGPMFDQRTRIYGVSLHEEACFPFAPPAEIQHCSDSAEFTQVAWEGLTERLWPVPVEPDNYFNLQAGTDFLYVQSRPAGGQQNTLHSIALADNHAGERQTFARDVANYQLSHERDRLLIQPNDIHQLYITDARAEAPGADGRDTISTRNWQLAFSPREEWQQMFRDAWLMHRDFLFDPEMRGRDWAGLYEQYQPLVDRLTDRHELDDLLAQLLSELNVLHSQVRGGEYPTPSERASAATLGARFTSDANGLQLATILQGDPELPETASPLARPGVQAAEGDRVVAVNGREVRTYGELHRVLRGQAGRQVKLELARDGEEWATIVEPVSTFQDHRLRYQHWVEQNRQQVEESSDGDFGYLHLYAMGPNDVASFAREFYANFEREGLVIDVRRNRGGNIDSWIIEKLLRRAWSFWSPRQGDNYTNMQQAFRGQLVVLTDQLTYSDGETFSAGIKELELGPLLGNRTTGAGVWLSGRNQLADRGVARVAETPQHAMDGRWIIEGYGVKPDIEVDNLPHATFQGEDAQLTRALEVLRQMLAEEPVPELEAQDMSAPYADDIQ